MKLGILSIGVGLALAATGCGYGPSDYCDDRCDCQGCSDADYDDCVDEAEDVESEAIDEGCDDEYDDVAACFEDTGECRHEDVWDVDCDDELLDLVECCPSCFGGVRQ